MCLNYNIILYVGLTNCIKTLHSHDKIKEYLNIICQKKQAA